ncbi:ABC transporter substrate-binding protein [Cellulomonas triticagri]|uniref:ABC transporter substrate-binding protein n=1 Tax=Cellulomonas triticagri TaxID=2483352 RepID=A0A3M2JC14_9CELL|nr:ABC transporter substrate-binding protein [Cellulomonas triticagri]RMI09053.1 ABC transporter substrate-binding protein [Cellulomonas triticagri]
MFLRSAGAHRRPSRRTIPAAAGVAALALLVTACSGGGGGGGDSTGGGGDGTTLVAYTGQSGDYQINFNPFSPSRIGGLGTIYEQLFFINKAAESDPVPLLGTEYAWNDDGTELTVTLRDDVTWTDGEAFTADDVVFTFDLLAATPAINNIGYAGTATASDDTHVVFTFEAPAFVQGPDVLSGVPIVPEHLWTDVDPTADVVEEPVGTGAFLLGDFKPQAFTYTANPDYWGGEPALQTVRFLSLSGNTAGADGIAAGTIDWQTGPVPDMQNVSTNFPGYDTLTAWQNQMVLATCSSVEQGCAGPQTDPAVRQALYLAMDRTQLNSLAFQETANEISPTFALTTSQESFISSAIDEPVAPETADPEGAAAVLEAAGWVKGSDGIFAKDGQKLTVTVEVVTGWTDYITAVQTLGQQAKAAGIDLQTAQSSWNEWTERRTQGNFQLAIDSLWQGPAPDPYYLYTYFFASGSGAAVGEAAGNNYSRFSDPEVDAALEQLKTLPLDDAAARQPLFDEIQATVVEQMPYVPILTGGNTSQWNVGRFSGWPTEDDMYAFPAVWSAFDAAEILKRLEPTGS